MSALDAIIAVSSVAIAAEMRRLVDPEKVLVVGAGVALCGVRTKLVIVTFTARAIAFDSEALREGVQQWIDDLELKLVPGGKVIHSAR